MGTLYVVATPIGNMQDMTLRAIETLRDVDLIAAEDTRHSGGLLKAHGIETPMISYHHHNRMQREHRLLEELSRGDVALISDAGTPGIADPGRELVAAARTAGYRVVPVPGASSIAAVSVSGLVEGPFVFLGFLTRKGEERRSELVRASATGWPLVIFESPNRLGGTLADLMEALGDRETMIARELTKLHEELVVDRLTALVERYRCEDVRGEIVIVVGAAKESGESGDVEGLIRRLLANGMKPSKVAREVSVIGGLPGDEAYALVRQVGRSTR